MWSRRNKQQNKNLQIFNRSFIQVSQKERAKFMALVSSVFLFWFAMLKIIKYKHNVEDNHFK